MATADGVLRVARAELGTLETPVSSNRTKYGKAYGMDGVAWCAIFCWYVFGQAGASDLIMQKTAYTPTLYDWYRQRGRASTTPQVGSLVFFNWPGDGVNRIQHVGIVEAVEPAAIVTIEGNTQSGDVGNQSDGGGVWRRRRARNSSIVGYGHPTYAPATSVEDDLPTPEEVWSYKIPDPFTSPTDPNHLKPARDLVGWSATHAAFARGDAAEARKAVAALAAQVAQLKATGGGVAGPAQLSDQDVQRIAAAVLDLLAKRTAS